LGIKQINGILLMNQELPMGEMMEWKHEGLVLICGQALSVMAWLERV
jgi:hypothetical protein